MKNKTILAGLLVAALLTPCLMQPVSASDTVVTEQEILWAESIPQNYQSFDELLNAVEEEQLPLAPSHSIQTVDDVYALGCAVKVNGKNVKLQQIRCTFRSVVYRYDNDVTFCYYPNYKADEGLTNSYRCIQKEYIQRKKTTDYTIYVSEVTTPEDVDLYVYT